MSGATAGQGVDGLGSPADADCVKARMRAVAAQMRELSAALDAHGTLADARPGGYADAHRCIEHARELAGAARMLESWAREMGQ